MLTVREFSELSVRLSLSVEGLAHVEHIRHSEPSRRVGGGAANVASRYPSRKMGMVIQAESQLELSAIYLKEHDPAVFEYYDQPPVLKLTYEAPRRQRVLYTPDFFVIERDAVGWEEWRPEERLVRLAAKFPERYQRDETGTWHFLPGEQFAEPLGLFFRLHSSAEVNQTLVRNLIMLQDYLHEDMPEIADDVVRFAQQRVKDEPGITLAQLVRLVPADDVFRLLACGELYVDLTDAALADAERVKVFLDELTRQAYERISVVTPDDERSRSILVEPGTSITWDGRPWRIVNVGDTCVALAGDERQVVDLPLAMFEQLVSRGAIRGVGMVDEHAPRLYELLSQASTRELRRANDIFDLVRSSDAAQHIPARTLRRWKKLIREAELEHGYGYVGLLRRHNQGNRYPKLPPRGLALMDQVIDQQYETLVQRRRRSAYGELARQCELEGIVAPSYKSFCLRLRVADRYRQTLKRRGARAAYQVSEFVSYLDRGVAPHGDRPFEVAHIDHTEADIEVRHSRTGTVLGRPWLTLMVDAYSRRVLAFHLTFDPPSYRSCMAVIRECVRRHDRLPDTVVVDGGKEFASVYFESLLAAYGCTKKTRPASKARFGAVLERLFGTTNTQFFYNLTGNTQITKNVCEVTKAISPKTLAVWTLPALHQSLSQWVYEVYDQTEHPALGQSPCEAYSQRLAQTGLRHHRLVRYDEAFLLATMPSTRKGTAQVIANRGVQINGLYYWSRTFSDPLLVGEQLAVRFDPFDVGTAFAYVRGQWERCFSQYASVFRGRSERELQLATAELRQQRRNHAHGFSVTARRLADFLQSTAADELLLSQRLRDAECARAHGEAHSAGSMPIAAEHDVPLDADHDNAPVEETIYPAYPMG